MLVPAVAVACAGGGDTDAAGGEGNGANAPAEAAEGEARRDTTKVNRFLSYSADDSLARLKLWAGFGGANSAWNFNGYYAGNATVVVPLDWRVEVTYQTLDANIPHSAAVVETEEEIPRSGAGVELAFPGASTRSFATGIPSTADPVKFHFRANEAGRYWIFCGVPGHAAGGMWIWLEVSGEAATPDFRTDTGG